MIWRLAVGGYFTEAYGSQLANSVESGTLLTMVYDDFPIAAPRTTTPIVFFTRTELNRLLDLYGRMVSQGLWRDYAIDGLRGAAQFSVYRRSSEVPLYRIEKRPALARRQGAWSVFAPGGLILKRGHELEQVLKTFDRLRFRVVD